LRINYFADIRLPLERANGIQTVETCYALAERGHDVWLIARPDTRRPARDPYVYYGIARHPRLAIEAAPVRGPQFARRIGYLSFALGRALGRDKADVLFTRDLGVAAMFLRVPRAMRPPVVYESHGFAPEVSAELPGLVSTARPASAAKLKRLGEREALVWRQAEGYVTITRALADRLAERFGPRPNLAVVPDGVRLKPQRVWSPLPDEPLVAYAGHLYAWKGVDVLLDALARVPSARGLVAGGHEAEADIGRLRARAHQLGIADRIEFAGLVAPAAVPGLLERARILVLPNLPSTTSSYFTSPLKLFEYMAAGRAIVASDLPALREVLRHGDNAILVAPGDPEALAAAIQQLLDDPDRAGRIARTAFGDAAAFGWDQRAAGLEPVLKQAQTA
jgi:glycosyltransferase involved in cell wall biosynthesis